MPTLHIDSSDDQILDVVRAWNQAVVRQDYQTAFGLTSHDPYYAWTPHLIRSVIEGYGHPTPRADGVLFRATNTLKDRHTPVLDRWLSPRPTAEGHTPLGLVTLHLELNGEESDVTAQFELRLHGTEVDLVLADIHVL